MSALYLRATMFVVIIIAALRADEWLDANPDAKSGQTFITFMVLISTITLFGLLKVVRGKADTVVTTMLATVGAIVFLSRFEFSVLQLTVVVAIFGMLLLVLLFGERLLPEATTPSWDEVNRPAQADTSTVRQDDESREGFPFFDPAS